MTFEEAVEVLGGAVEPSEDEARNGWDTQALTVYLAQRHLEKSNIMLNPPPAMPMRTSHTIRWLVR